MIVSVKLIKPTLLRSQFFRYLSVSIVALFIDVAMLYVLAVRIVISAPLAGALAYATGLVAHYALATSHVFGFRRYAANRFAEFTLYAFSGLCGLCVTFLVLWGGNGVGFPLWASKAVAIAASFIFTYVVRRWYLFSRRHDMQPAN